MHNIFNLFQLLYYSELQALKYLTIKCIALEALLADSMTIHRKCLKYNSEIMKKLFTGWLHMWKEHLGGMVLCTR